MRQIHLDEEARINSHLTLIVKAAVPAPQYAESDAR
jgi:hypothetical protein